MKKLLFIVATTTFLLLLVASSCIKRIEKVEKDPNSPEEQSREAIALKKESEFLNAEFRDVNARQVQWHEKAKKANQEKDDLAIKECRENLLSIFEEKDIIHQRKLDFEKKVSLYKNKVKGLFADKIDPVYQESLEVDKQVMAYLDRNSFNFSEMNIEQTETTVIPKKTIIPEEERMNISLVLSGRENYSDVPAKLSRYNISFSYPLEVYRKGDYSDLAIDLKSSVGRGFPSMISFYLEGVNKRHGLQTAMSKDDISFIIQDAVSQFDKRKLFAVTAEDGTKFINNDYSVDAFVYGVKRCGLNILDPGVIKNSKLYEKASKENILKGAVSLEITCHKDLTMLKNLKKSDKTCVLIVLPQMVSSIENWIDKNKDGYNFLPLPKLNKEDIEILPEKERKIPEPEYEEEYDILKIKSPNLHKKNMT